MTEREKEWSRQTSRTYRRRQTVRRRAEREVLAEIAGQPDEAPEQIETQRGQE
jgi:hypothetical protein